MFHRIAKSLEMERRTYTFFYMDEVRFKFQSKKTAQAVAFLLKRAGGRISKGHLIKMLYGADRRQIRRTGMPITGDQPFSMKNGPVLSNVLDLLDGDRTDAFWAKRISRAARDTHTVSLLVDVPDDLLSENEKESLAKACDFFVKMSWEEVKVFCHNPKNFGEWEDPGDSRKPIAFERIMKEVGRPDFAAELKSLQAEEDLIAAILA